MTDWSITPEEWEAIRLSMKVAASATICSLPLALALGWLLARRHFVGKTLLNGVANLPLVAPPVVMGYLLLVVLGRNGPIGSFLHDTFGLSFVFTWQGAALAAGVVSFPLLLRPVRQAFESIDQRIENAARTLGAGPWDTFLTITFPLAAPGIIAGMVTAFARSLGEFGATITFVSNIPGETRTLPLALYSVTQTPDGEEAALRLTFAAFALALAGLAASEYFSHRLSELR